MATYWENTLLIRLFLIAPFPDLCLLEPFHLQTEPLSEILVCSILKVYTWRGDSSLST